MEENVATEKPATEKPATEKPVKEEKAEEPASPEEKTLYDEFKAKVEQEKACEIKLQIAIEFMREALAQAGAPQFKEFWEVKKLCLELFKENLCSSKLPRFCN